MPFLLKDPEINYGLHEVSQDFIEPSWGSFMGEAFESGLKSNLDSLEIYFAERPAPDMVPIW